MTINTFLFVKETLNGKGNAVKYLAGYCRTAIANSHILSMDDETVTFPYKDYLDDRTKSITVKGETFIDLFLMHVLPSGFHRVRFSDHLTNSRKNMYDCIICS